MKTETKTIKCWANYYAGQQAVSSLVILHDEGSYAESVVHKAGITVPCTITLELPAEQKKVTITESDYDKAFDEWNSFRGIHNGGIQQFVKAKLFGGG